MTELKNKPLGEWTLEEVKKYCKSIVECKRDECPFCINYGECILMDIDNPSNWDLSEKPRLTKSELDICEAVEAKWVSKNNNTCVVELWNDKPYPLNSSNSGVCFEYGGAYLIAKINDKLFPSVNAGDIVCVEGEY